MVIKRLSADLKNPFWIYLKALLFLTIALTAAVLILIEIRSWKVGLLLCTVIWACCRLYYFAFYVIQHYVDGKYRFAGLIDFLRYLLGKPRR